MPRLPSTAHQLTEPLAPLTLESGVLRRLAPTLAAILIAALGCAPDESPTQPGGAEEPGAGAPALAAVANSWTTVSPGMDVSRIVAGTAPNAAGQELVYTFDTQGEETGIEALLRRLGEHGIDFKDLQSSESSLEDIFVSLVRAQA